jgi:cytochrome c2
MVAQHSRRRMCRVALPPLARLLVLLAGFTLWFDSLRAAEPGRFFETKQPFFQTQVDVAASMVDPPPEGNLAVRGVLIPVSLDFALVFDQELLRVAGFWVVPLEHPPVTLQTMAQMSYHVRRRKAADDHPRPTGPVLLSTGMHPGVGADIETLFTDPRPPARPGDHGRGALPASWGRFEGVQLLGDVALLHYRSGETLIREWFEIQTTEGQTRLLRHLEISASAQPLHLALGAGGMSARGAPASRGSGRVTAAANTPAVTFSEHQGELVATIAPAAEPRRLTIAVLFPGSSSGSGPSSRSTERNAVPSTPPLPERNAAPRWPESVVAPAELGVLSQNGLLLDRIAVPDENPWARRVRAADLAFLDQNRAAVVTYDGDVWLVDGLADPKLSRLSWRRFASGLHEPLAIASPDGILQVATKNGVVRLYDHDGNGDADWFENFNDQMIQSQTTRSFPLDMAVAPDGSTFVTQGGIVNQSGVVSGGTGTSHAGAILRIARDGRSSSVFAERAREPFLTVHPTTGMVTGTDQQGHYIPSSVVYLIREGDTFGFLEENPARLTPPLAWIPHDQDSSSSSQVWMVGPGMGPWNGRLLHLSYGTGRLFVIAPDLDAPVPQGAVIPLDLQTDLPLLHARMHPAGDAVFLAGFQIWGTRTLTPWALGRLRPGPTPIETALNAFSTTGGVVLQFGSPLDPASLQPERVAVRAWNYRRSSAYGSGRYTPDGSEGTATIGVGQTIASRDGRSVFVHLPGLPATMQVEVRHDFRLADGAPARGVVYFTIHEHRPLDFAAAGFPEVDLSRSRVVVAQQKEDPPSIAMGKAVAENLGCVACHSADGTSEGQIGPTWRGLFGSRRTFVDGTSQIADELYIREKILDPLKRRVSLTQAEMPSYRGVVTETQLEALVLYIRSLSNRRLPE